MKRLFTTIAILVLGQAAVGQTGDYRTAEDGLNRLLGNPQFIEDVMQMSKGAFTPEQLNEYLRKYVPEYSSFNMGSKAIDLSKVYYANAEGASTEQLANLLGGALKLDPVQSQLLKNAFTGNLNHTPTSAYSTGRVNQLYDRGKDPKVDMGVDLAVDFFQGKFGDGGVNSQLIDIGGALLGQLALELNKRFQEREERMLLEQRLFRDNFVYTMGHYTDDKFKEKVDPEQAGLRLHYQAKKNMPNNTGILVEKINLDQAIQSLDEAIARYKQNPDRAYYLYMAYTDRALCKMQKGAYRAAIIDYYFAQKVLETVLSGKLPDQSIAIVYPKGYLDAGNKKTYRKGKTETKIGLLGPSDLVNVILNRAFAKYRAADYNGAVTDARLAAQKVTDNYIPASGQPNDYRDISLAIVAMSQFQLGQYKESYHSFISANLNDDLIQDSDNDGVTDFSDASDESNRQNILAAKESRYPLFYGFPNYFPFDIVQIRGLSFYKEGKLDDAIAIYEQLSASEKGEMTYDRGAKRTFTKVGGDMSAVYASLSSFYYSKGDLSKSIKLLDDAITINPGQLEYYLKRGTYKKANNQLQEAERDFSIVKHPELLKNTAGQAKSHEYYQTKYHTAVAANNKKAVFDALKEAMQAYPDDEKHYLPWAITYLQDVKSSADADELARLLTPESRSYHLLKSLHYAYSGNNHMEEAEMTQAFQKGANFFRLTTWYPDLLLRGKKYYCRLFHTFGSKTNNNFIDAEFNRMKEEKAIDSLYTDLKKQYGAAKSMNGILNKQQKMHTAKYLGAYEDYLKILNGQKTITEAAPPHSLDKFELLVILGRKDEAVEFAEKVYKEGKLLKLEESNHNVRYANQYYYAIENIAKGACK